MAGLVSWSLMPTRASPRDVSGGVDFAPSREFHASVVAGDVLVEGIGQILVLIMQMVIEGL